MMRMHLLAAADFLDKRSDEEVLTATGIDRWDFINIFGKYAVEGSGLDKPYACVCHL